MFRIGIIVGMVIMIFVPTWFHNRIRSTLINGVEYCCDYMKGRVEEERKYEIKKILKENEDVSR